MEAKSKHINIQFEGSLKNGEKIHTTIVVQFKEAIDVFSDKYRDIQKEVFKLFNNISAEQK